jgi:prepilin-type N-terminal cleavage/methylation domain-containing protein
MRSASIGIRAASRLFRNCARKRAGFTLLEALVALALILAFAATLGPYLFHARQIMAGVDRRIAAQVLLRSLLDAPVNRSALAHASREGETAGLRWWITAAPILIGPVAPPPRQKMSLEKGQKEATPERPNWTPFRVIASVSWGRGQSISAETVRLGKME